MLMALVRVRCELDRPPLRREASDATVFGKVAEERVGAVVSGSLRVEQGWLSVASRVVVSG